jgi:2-C-methyl-D-erythritol 2,4-cyclodiphosphate synthase
MRVGYGYDVHRLEEGEPLILGGVTIPHERGLVGHSDADVLLHAITDALLGAAALGDIGAHFPDTDAAWSDADSLQLLGRIRDRVQEAGFVPHNVDATVVLERPKLQPYVEAMRKNVADVLGVPMERVAVKATTNEGLGAIGRGEGAKSHAVCTLEST